MPFVEVVLEKQDVTVCLLSPHHYCFVNNLLEKLPFVLLLVDFVLERRITEA